MKKDYLLPHLNCFNFPLCRDFDLKTSHSRLEVCLSHLLNWRLWLNYLRSLNMHITCLMDITYGDGSAQCLIWYTMTVFIVLFIILASYLRSLPLFSLKLLSSPILSITKEEIYCHRISSSFSFLLKWALLSLRILHHPSLL